MNPALALLDRAGELLEQEAAAVQTDDAENVEQLVAEREALLEKAWEARHSCDPEAFLAKLSALKEQQERQLSLCVAERDRLRGSIGGAKQVAQYMEAPKARLQSFHRSLLFSKTS